MSTLTDGVRDGLDLILSGDRDVVDVTLRTVRVGVEATGIAAVLGLPLGCAIGLGSFRGRGVLQALVNAGISFPPVALGQIVWILLWPSSRWGGGPLAGLGWIYTDRAVVLVQTLLVLPIVAALTASAIQALPPGLLDQARAYGAPGWQRGLLAVREARIGVVAALTAGLGTAVAAVGAVVVVGGKAGASTLPVAVLTQWQAGGQDAAAVAYGTVLLGVFLVLAAVLTLAQQQDRPWLRGRAS